MDLLVTVITPDGIENTTNQLYPRVPDVSPVITLVYICSIIILPDGHREMRHL